MIALRQDSQTTLGRGRCGGVRRRVVAWLGAACAVTGVAASASAQATDIEPVYVVVTQDTALRCDAGAAWYAIADLKPGQVLRADGVSFDWLRVQYPQGTPAVVKASEAELRTEEQRVVLTRQTRLRAFNKESARMETCYKAVAQDLLLPGLSLRYMGSVQNNRGEVAGYRVAAPAGARGYVLESATRRATEAEVQAVIGALGGAATPAVADAKTKPGTSAQLSGTPAPMQAQDTESAAPITTAAGERPGQETALGELNMELPAEVQRSMQTIATLERAYKKVAEQPLEQAELQPLIDEYGQLADSAKLTEAGQQVARFAEMRIELLKVRRELQKSSAALAALDAEVERTSETFATIDEQISTSADYDVIGRLVPSAVYTGGQMPLLYRLQAVDGASTRTMAYIAPAPDLRLEGKLGAVVGVRGTRRVDGYTGPVGVQVIEPTLVTVLTPASVAEAQDEQ